MAPGEDSDCMTAASSAKSCFPPPIAESAIKDGIVSGVLPETEVLAVHYPGYPSPSRAIETLSGLPRITKAWNCALQNLGGFQDSDKDRRRFLELKFRPEDPYCHPAFGEPRSSCSFLLRISRTQNGNATVFAGAPVPAEKLSADVVAKVSLAYDFEGMADYQHVIAVHAAESRRKKKPWASDDELFLDDNGNLDMDHGDVMRLVPPLFARKDKPEKIVLNSPANLISESLQKGAVEYYWEMDIEPCHAIPFSINNIPKKINWEDKLPKGTTEWDAQIAMSKLFEERPIWPRWSLHERLLDDGHEVTEYLLRRLLFRTGYYFSRGPFGRFWIRKGYDPRENPDSRIYQKVDFRMPPNLKNLNDVNANSELKHKWKDICKFKVWPLKASKCLQLFELDDDYIREEIEKATTLKSCSALSGWFSESKLRGLRLRVLIRFMEVSPKGAAAEELLKAKIEDFKRYRKKEALSKFWKPEKDNHSQSQEILIRETLQVHPIEEEEVYDEEELDVSQSPPVQHMVGEDGVPHYSASYEMGDGIPNEYLQELLSGFTDGKDGKYYQPDEQAQGSSDDDYHIYEQHSSEDELSFS